MKRRTFVVASIASVFGSAALLMAIIPRQQSSLDATCSLTHIGYTNRPSPYDTAAFTLSNAGPWHIEFQVFPQSIGAGAVTGSLRGRTSTNLYLPLATKLTTLHVLCRRCDTLRDTVRRWMGRLGFKVPILGYECSLRSPEFRALTDAEQRIEPLLLGLRRGLSVDGRKIEAFAADAVTRNTLYRALRQIGHPDSFPETYRTLEAIGESDLVAWLQDPGAWNVAPDEIQTVKQFDRQYEDDTKSHYVLYRFRMHPPHPFAEKGWLIGVAGPYWEGADPYGSPYGVRSRFEAVDARTIEDHFEALTVWQARY